ncbi:CHAP domain-containing protein [Altererythrobacter aerius]|uniref:CHAP domain-containing protein n=1 Tax=Tsuneonella aeria TaxID=1837929 RepID=A0A6I4TBG8_9SPHN|nr:CHAP domain-containing protein [Tsuneonella aeria]MXO74681.1 CHAP domain-containing protein [Tsuneonella aeria]
MKCIASIIALMCALAVSGPAAASASEAFEAPAGQVELAPYLQCVPYARERSGVQIFGDAHTWWDQAEGRYRRGSTPRPGAVMAFRSTGSMVLGHVAAVASVVDSRTVLLDHANWSPINGRRGQVERGVKAVDVSPANDWSQVRVWYAPIGALGITAFPVAGFIYPEPAGGGPFGGRRVLARADHAPATDQPPISPAPSRRFASAFASLGEPRAAMPALAHGMTAGPRPRRTVAEPARPRDPITAAIARYGS